jgi:hypothetical protein
MGVGVVSVELPVVLVEVGEVGEVLDMPNLLFH